MADKKKKKKEKIKYIDDGRTIYDMSGTSKTSVFFGGKNDPKKRQRSTRREELNTFVSTMRQMILPMLIVMGIITFAFGIMYLILKFGV